MHDENDAIVNLKMSLEGKSADEIEALLESSVHAGKTGDPKLIAAFLSQAPLG